MIIGPGVYTIYTDIQICKVQLARLKTFSIASAGGNVWSDQEAQAVGVAFDYRKLNEIDPSTRRLRLCETCNGPVAMP